jgi:hypothetical protein
MQRRGENLFDPTDRTATYHIREFLKKYYRDLKEMKGVCMKDEDRLRVNFNFLQIYESLSKSLYEAGGTMLSSDDLQSMSAFDLLCFLAPNSIRFCVTKATGGTPPEKKSQYKLRQGVDDWEEK